MDIDMPTIVISSRRPLRERRLNRRIRQQEENEFRDREPVNVIDELSPQRPGGGCIDLTSSTTDEDYIDLTSPVGSRNNPVGVNDSPVVLLEHVEDAVNHGHRSGRTRHRRRPRREAINTEVLPGGIDDSVVFLPDLETVNPGTTEDVANVSVSSEGQGSITCPICFDDKKQIQRSGRQLCSTICGHVFCQPCIKTAVASQRCCPTCRKKLTNKNIFPLFI